MESAATTRIVLEPAVVEWERDGDEAVAHLAGEVDLSNADLVEGAVLQRVGRGRLALDLRHLRFMDSVGLRLLVRLDAALAPDRLTLVVEAGSPVDRLLELTGLRDVLRVAPG